MPDVNKTPFEQGQHAALLEQKGVYASLVAHQLQKQAEQLSDGPAGGGGGGGAQPHADGIDALFDSATGARSASSSSSEEEGA
eukprot:3059115-Prymnesium_polylepis.1